VFSSLWLSLLSRMRSACQQGLQPLASRQPAQARELPPKRSLNFEFGAITLIR
jgi:hypothetical protein